MIRDWQIVDYEKLSQPLDLRTQKLVNYLEDLWKRPQEMSPDLLKRIVAFLARLPEPYRSLGITKIGELLVDGMSLHFLGLMAIFQENAESEGMDKDEISQTLQSVIVDVFPDMMKASKQILLRSLEDLVTLGNITIGLRTLSHSSTAEEAQNWLYELPALYLQQMTQSRLMKVQFEVARTPVQVKNFTLQSVLPAPVDVSEKQKNTIIVA